MKFASQIAVILAVTTALSACSDSATPPDDDDVPLQSTVAVSAVPDPPPGRVISCPENGTSSVNGPTCSVIRFKGLTYFAFNYDDDRPSVAFVGYNSNNVVTKTLAEHGGAKSIWQITVNESQETITLRGQNDATVTILWSELQQ